ncbi:receptor-binding cancer antigen expressed on SiSo cells-like [Oscarella lobularis]|uniref:receptor-binding cancer antigen expressed on SiSo cells-like n=1 Tax=Oscarella lobularis TaxID=121494 RepID=UPI003313B9D5
MSIFSSLRRLVYFVCNLLGAPLKWLGVVKKKKVDEIEDDVRVPLRQRSNQEEADDSEWQDWENSGGGADDADLRFVSIDPASKPNLSNSSMPAINQVDPSGGGGSDSFEDIDLFQDMKPVFRKAKKITIRSSSQSEEETESGRLSSRLAMDNRPISLSADLETWTDDVTTWEDETSLDPNEVEEQVRQSLKEKREAERARRQAEQERRKQERDTQKQHQQQHRGIGTKVT